MTCLTVDEELVFSIPVQLEWYLCMANYFHISVKAVGLLAPVRHWALPHLIPFSQPDILFWF